MDILYEAGEAIDNVGRRLFKGKRARQAEEALTRWSQQVPIPRIPPSQGERIHAQYDAIDVDYRILTEEHEPDAQEGDSR